MSDFERLREVRDATSTASDERAADRSPTFPAQA